MGALKHPCLPSGSLSLLPNPTLSAWRAWSLNWWKGADYKWKCIWIMYIIHTTSHLLISSSRLCHVTRPCNDQAVCVTGPWWCGLLRHKHSRCFSSSPMCLRRKCISVHAHARSHFTRQVFQHRRDYSSYVLSSGRKYSPLRQQRVCRRGENNAPRWRDFCGVALADSQMKTKCDVDIRAWACRRPHLSVFRSVRHCTHAPTW